MRARREEGKEGREGEGNGAGFSLRRRENGIHGPRNGKFLLTLREGTCRSRSRECLPSTFIPFYDYYYESAAPRTFNVYFK